MTTSNPETFIILAKLLGIEPDPESLKRDAVLTGAAALLKFRVQRTLGLSPYAEAVTAAVERDPSIWITIGDAFEAIAVEGHRFADLYETARDSVMRSDDSIAR